MTDEYEKGYAEGYNDCLKKYKYLIKWLSESFGTPCQYGFNGEGVDEFMLIHRGEWCDKSCGNVSVEECWEQFLEAKMEHG